MHMPNSAHFYATYIHFTHMLIGALLASSMKFSEETDGRVYSAKIIRRRMVR
jgi:hypothetical protein